MSKVQCRVSIVGAVLVLALLSTRPAAAQVGFDPGPPREPGGLANNLATGAYYDIVNQAKAERRLQFLHGKIERDAERGHTDAVARDARQINNLHFRVAVDEWLIRQNMLYNPGCYPYPVRLDPLSCEAISQYRPLGGPYRP